MFKLPFFSKEKSGGIQFSQEKNNLSPRLLFCYFLLVGLFFLVLVLRLFQLTVVKGSYYRQLSENNRIKELLIEPQRGEIKDRKGFVVAKNLPADINSDLIGVNKTTDRIPSLRIYENSEINASIIGYRQLADENDFKNDHCLQKLKLGDKVGKKGVEKLYDCDLRGQPGKKLIEVDAKGKYLNTLTVLPPQKGKTIQLAFDQVLQKKAYDLIKDKRAAAVGVNSKTGEILFLVSSPSYDPQYFENQQTDQISKYLTDEQKPLFNRVTAGTYPPGSLFKLVIATGALEEKAIDEKTQFEDTGQLQAGPLKFGNWYFLQYGKTEGMVDIIKAIRRSNDIFFYKAGEAVGADKIKKWSDILGYGKKTNFGLDESEGMVPSPFWKQETLKDRWYTGDSYNLSIGQGYVTVTPLQITMVTSVFANGGYLCKPELLKMYGQGSALSLQSNCKRLPISPKTLNLIREGMKEACSPGGTGWPLFNFKFQISNFKFKEVQVACKTGTAESTQVKSGMPHAWITVFAPFDNPEIALTVLIEEGGQGSDIAGPIAKEILKAYFERKE